MSAGLFANGQGESAAAAPKATVQEEKTVTLVYAEVNPLETIVGKTGSYFKEQVEKLSGGTVKIDIQASGVLGSENDVLDSMVPTALIPSRPAKYTFEVPMKVFAPKAPCFCRSAKVFTMSYCVNALNLRRIPNSEKAPMTYRPLCKAWIFSVNRWYRDTSSFLYASEGYAKRKYTSLTMARSGTS